MRLSPHANALRGGTAWGSCWSGRGSKLGIANPLVPIREFHKRLTNHRQFPATHPEMGFKNTLSENRFTASAHTRFI